MQFLKSLKFTWKYVKEQKKNFIWYIILGIMSIIISVMVPMLSAKIIIDLTNNMFEQLIFMAILIFIIENIRNLVHYAENYHGTTLYRETFIRIQTVLGREMLKLENKVIDDNGTGLFIQRMTGDSSRISDAFPMLINYLTNIMTNIGIFGAIFVINKLVFLYTVLIVLILYFIEKKRVKLRNENDKKYRKLNEKVSSYVGEMTRGVRDIKVLNSEDSFINELYNRVYKLNNSRYDTNKIDRKYRLLRGFGLDLNTLTLILLLVFLIKNGELSVASALVIHNYSDRVTSIIYWLGDLLEVIKDFNLSVDRIREIIEGDKFKKEHFGNKHLDKVNGNFEFENVSFSYDKNKIFNNLSFKVDSNKTVAFVGKSGEGKSTIFNLICKLYDIDSGTIKIDGVDINELDKDSIRGNITVINQSPYIFNVSIKDNLKLVKENLTDSEMKKACKIACLHDFIMSLPDKYDTIVGEGGVNLSGGQKQRLAIARALVQKTKIILFDEATSALDNETQKEIQDAINNMKGKYTILIIAHRFSTILNSDKIMLLEDGEIIIEGTHEELLKKSKEYKMLYESELKQ